MGPFHSSLIDWPCRLGSLSKKSSSLRRDEAVIGEAAHPARTYEQLSLDCLNLVEAARDAATQDRLLQHWARLAGRLASPASRCLTRGGRRRDYPGRSSICNPAGS